MQFTSSHRTLVIGSAAIMIVVVLLVLGYLAPRRRKTRSAAFILPGVHWNYTTDFPLIENPISESGRWINGGTTGLDWNNVQTFSGFVGGVGPAAVRYADPTAVLAGAWGPNQTVMATVYSAGASNAYYQEVELRLRSTMSPHKSTGYEVMFRTPSSPRAYVAIARWNGPLADFTPLCSVSGIGVDDGDVVTAAITGSSISAYINGALKLSCSDTTYTTGSPGVGFDYGCDNTYRKFGFTSFNAADGSKSYSLEPNSSVSGSRE